MQNHTTYIFTPGTELEGSRRYGSAVIAYSSTAEQHEASPDWSVMHCRRYYTYLIPKSDLPGNALLEPFPNESP